MILDDHHFGKSERIRQIPGSYLVGKLAQEKILVPVGPRNKDLKAVYHALALAERIDAKVFVFYFEPTNGQDDLRSLVEETLMDVINGACQEGLSVSYHIAQGSFEEEVIHIVNEKEIDFIVIGENERQIERSLRGIRSKVRSRIIKVREKATVNHSKRKER